ncbi:hypothetical protein AMTRI_Chr12g235620 [Amborella trichopoda]
MGQTLLEIWFALSGRDVLFIHVNKERNSLTDSLANTASTL